MASTPNLIPKAGIIEIADPPAISAIEFIRQVIENVNAQMLYIDNEVYKASVGDNSYVKALYDSVHEIKSRADQAEMILAQITNDPKTLEVANARIEGPADTLGKIKKLVITVQELEKELKEGEYDYYRIVAELLIDIQEQMDAFKSYIATPHIAQINNKIKAIERELGRQVQWSFREIGAVLSSEKYSTTELDNSDDVSDWNVDVSSLSQVYLIVDALGDRFRNDLLERFAQLQLIPYEKLFKYGTRYCELDYLEERFAWFKYLVRVIENKLSCILPSNWHITYFLFIEFTRRTKNHLSDVLKVFNEQQPVGIDMKQQVAYILKAIKSVVTFEAEMNASFSAKNYMESLDSNNATALPQLESIRDAFDPYLGPYVQLEREGLEELMSTMLREEDDALNAQPLLAASAAINKTATDSNGENPMPPPAASTVHPGEPFESSRKLFEYIKGSLKRCTGFSTGLTFLSLSKEFRINLQQYAESLKFRCPTPAIPAKNGKPAVYIITKKVETTLCRIICTGEYCIDTIPALETMMKQRIQEQYREEVDFTHQVDVFMDMISYAMNILAHGEVHRMEDYFTAMKKINWGTFDGVVTEEGKYSRQMLKVLADCVPRIRLWVSSVYLQNVCIKLITIFLDSYLENIYQLRRISKNGGGQLLLDLNGIKEYLLKLPNCKLPEGKEPLTIGKTYLMIVNNKVKKIENILKLVCTEDAMLEETFALLWPEATSADMDAILILKGSKNAIDQVGDTLKHVSKNTVGKISKAGDGLTSGFNKVGGNLKNAFGEMMSGNLFNEMDTTSKHSSGSAHGTAGGANSNANGSYGIGSSTNAGLSAANLKLKSTFSGVTAALNFNKKQTDTNTKK